MNNGKVLAEVYGILRHLSEENFNKIPKDVIKIIEENKDNDYIWEYDSNIPLKDHNISRDAIAVLSFINMEYLLNEEQRRLMEKIHLTNEKNEERIKTEKYIQEPIFKKQIANSSSINERVNAKNEVTDLVEVKKESIIKRIINKIKNFLR